MKKRMVGVAAAYLLAAAILFSLYRSIQKMPWYEKYPVICHALGKTQEGDTLTNSKEAFLYNYAQGQRVFEADIQITSDGCPVLRHDWNSDLGQGESFGWTQEKQWPVTVQEFLDAPIYEKYTPLTLEDWFAIMEQYSDIYFVTDTKLSSEATIENQFRLLVDAAVQRGHEDLLSRIIVQIYYKEMYDLVMSVYPFQNFIWTLYYIGYNEPQDISDFMTEKSIPVLTMPSSWWGKEKLADFPDNSIKVYVHTVNDESECRLRIDQGVSGFYSDVIGPSAVRYWLRQSR